ncbi:MAG: toxin-antitoxin system protein [Candidatus Melainabacteria bacterium]|nr:toxin-antitoxin system protein [Candidatus Melainabacteria bacterium]
MSRSLKERKNAQANVRIDMADKQVLDRLAAETGESHPKLLHKAVEQLKRKIFFEKMNRAYREMQTNPELWATEQAERNLFDNAVSDGLQS